MGFLSKVAKGIADSMKNQQVSEDYSYGEFIVIDVETTGLNPNFNRIVEIALLRVNNGIVTEAYENRFNPEGPVGKTEIHGITDEDVANAPRFSDKADEIKTFIGERALVAHNAKFDLAFLRAEFERSNNDLPWLKSICTLEASQYYLPELNRRKLADCCGEIGIQIDNAHSALGDAMATAKLCHFYLMPEKTPIPRDSDLNVIANPIMKEAPKSSTPSSHLRTRIGKEKDTRAVSSVSALNELKKLLAGVGIGSFLNELKIPGAVEYLEKLLEVLGDLSIDDAEQELLQSLKEVYGLTDAQVSLLNESLLMLVIDQALRDEKISTDERQEFKSIAEVLNIPESNILSLTKVAKAKRIEKLSRNLAPLPDSWKLGEPLRVGNNVVFTGCDANQRERLENESRKIGITIASAVTKKTAFLVSDGTWSGNKASDAADLGTRVVTPDEYEILLKYVQPGVITS
jgi:DNA polymerase-3 subunit epsilon